MCGLVVIVILLILIIYQLQNGKRKNSNVESFDTYFNHDMGVWDLNPKLFMSPSDAGLWAKYNWSERESNGLTVYDRVYDMNVSQQAYIPEDEGYGERMLDHPGSKDAYFDMRAMNLNPEYNTLAVYSTKDMKSQDPAIVYNGIPVTLSQKNY